MMVDAFGLPVTFEITGGQVADYRAAPELIALLLDAEAVVADKGYDSNNIRKTNRGATEPTRDSKAAQLGQGQR